MFLKTELAHSSEDLGLFQLIQCLSFMDENSDGQLTLFNKKRGEYTKNLAYIPAQHIFIFRILSETIPKYPKIWMEFQCLQCITLILLFHFYN